ncbi:two-component regulator propeller domain-containing protein [Siphonobacter sp. SORGH_AS_1065]|uniref:two-component regulator propeller domain-containing protein n=1 Tax=Siphonobacter sp. SORGH_AS_1065 TaxID=3041795 RepID=UPI00277F42C9|nr:two-component regulator propeller domain-containing protein [Siphonobacter sp. SORGH_AS_1065]MDQ1090535.1 ligand-binding sensor domain-containing protein/signal transduction histidine kinase/DNA-binding response OmpR family regulator [Siphonobacter sp. SORGH_AS_1065]
MNPSTLRTLLGLLGLLWGVLCQGQNIAFNHLGSENGLSQNSVLAIAQDTHGFIWMGTRYGLNRYDTRNFRVFKNDPSDSTTLSDNYILSLLADSRGKLWVGTTQGLNYYDSRKDVFQRSNSSAEKRQGLHSLAIHCLFEDSKGRIWVGTSNGVRILNHPRKSTVQALFKAPASQPPLEVRSIVEDAEGNFWIGTSKGLIRLRPQNGIYRCRWFTKKDGLTDDFITSLATDAEKNLWIGTKYGGVNLYQQKHFSALLPTQMDPNIRKIMPDKMGKIWIASLEGLYTYDPALRQLHTYRHDPENSKSLSQNSIYSLFEDTNGSIWVGTYYRGVDIVYSSSTPFSIYQNHPQANTLSNDVVSYITADDQAKLWIATEGGGLNYYDTQKGTFHAYKHQSSQPFSISSNLIKSLYWDKKGTMWVCTHLGGLNAFSPQTQRFTHFKHDPNQPHSLASDNVIALAEDARGKIWVGTDRNGISVLDPATGQFQTIDIHSSPLKISGIGIRNLFLDSKKNLWIATGSGLNRVDATGKKITAFTKRNTLHLKSDDINCVAEDAKGRIWIGTYYGGFCLLNPDGKSVTTFTEKDGLANDNVLGILEDDQHYLWLSTENGLSRFNPEQRTFKTYTTSDGLPANEFSPRAYFKSPWGSLYFGTNSGLVSFDPSRITLNQFLPPLVFTSLKLFNQAVKVGDGEGILPQDISSTSTVTFTHDQNIFSVDFALLNYIKPGKNQYAYQLQGFEKNWNYVKIPSATYTNLAPGTYTLLVKAANNDGIWTPQPVSLRIRILPPWWATWWAYLLYACSFSGLLFILIRFFWLRASLRRNQELHQLKLNFFTNISHEIRTHLTLILGPVDTLIEALREDPFASRQLQHVQNHSNRLLKLVSELMDFRRVESQKLDLKISRLNIVAFVDEIFASFEDAAQSNHLETSFYAQTPHFELYFDPQQMEKVLYNLLTNAFKFTPKQGRIEVSIIEKASQVCIQISNTGQGIASEHLKKLFTNYFQVQELLHQNTGYGIGLALAKSIVELHHGTLTVESTLPEAGRTGLTTFTIALSKHAFQELNQPSGEAASWKVSTPSFAVPSEEFIPSVDDPQRPLLLLIEDNPDVLTFIQESLLPAYRILTARNGSEGWQLATSQIPDVIVSDVTMPEMDGLELSEKLKQDDRTSHIPLILLTARASQAHQISGLARGVDDYLTKPFSVEILKLKIHNLLASREKMRQKYSRMMTLEPQQIPINTQDEVFLHKLISIIEAHLDHPDFGVNKLASEVAMSTPVLYRKLKALTDLSVNDFIKTIRLKKAAQLLISQPLTVYEVAYAVGFDDRKYFSKEFKKYFGQTPSEYASLHQSSEM